MQLTNIYYLCNQNITYMQTNNLVKVLLAAVVVFSFSSCMKDDIYNPDNSKGTGNLEVPANFNWTMSRSIACNISTPVDSRIAIFSGKECKDEQLIIEMPILKGDVNQANFELSDATNSYYIQYPTANGMKIKEVSATATTRAGQDITLPEDIIYDSENNYRCSYTPAKNTFGTIFFEDMYPEKGDYDFNDFVAGYNTSVKLAQNIATADDIITIQIQIRAIGGATPYRLGLELTPVLTKYVTGNYNVASTNNNIQMELISTDPESPAIFAITGTNTLKEGNYFNTENLSTQPLPVITCTITRKQQQSWSFVNLFTDSTGFNFFLQNTANNKEIHMKGYPTTKLASNQGDSFVSSDNFVWGIKIPASIPNSKERVDITKSFPDFATWVTSGGTNKADWYNNYQKNQVITPVNP